MPTVKPISRYREPRYPTAEQALRDPALLRRTPKRFSAIPAVCAALSATLALGLAGCQADPGAEETNALNVPVFAHGEGIGSYGCVSVAPPVFLSEEEALSVIRDEAAKYGLECSASEKTITAQLPLHNASPLKEDHMNPLKTARGELTLDGYFNSAGIGVEFVSVDDLAAWQDPSQTSFSSVESYFFRDAADALSAGNKNLAVFYDPAAADFSEFQYDWPEEDDGGKSYAAYLNEYTARQKEKSLDELRAQVKDFLEWLQGQGVI